MKKIVCMALVAVLAIATIAAVLIVSGSNTAYAKDVVAVASVENTATASSLQGTQTCAAEQVVIAQMFGKSAKLAQEKVAGDAMDTEVLMNAMAVTTNSDGAMSTAYTITTAKDSLATAMDTTRAPGLNDATTITSAASIAGLVYL